MIIGGGTVAMTSMCTSGIAVVKYGKLLTNQRLGDNITSGRGGGAARKRLGSGTVAPAGKASMEWSTDGGGMGASATAGGSAAFR